MRRGGSQRCGWKVKTPGDLEEDKKGGGGNPQKRGREDRKHTYSSEVTSWSPRYNRGKKRKKIHLEKTPTKRRD